jgi:hypothetical protein
MLKKIRILGQSAPKYTNPSLEYLSQNFFLYWNKSFVT